MRVLVIGSGGVGGAVARTAAHWGLFERVVMADYDLDRARHAVAGAGERFAAYKLDARNEDEIVELIRTEHVDAVLNAVDPRFVMPIFRAAFTAGVTYLDMAMSLSHPHPTDPFHTPGVKLGDEQFAMADQWQERGLMALCGMGVEPGLSDVFARYAADKLFSTIEECLNPPIVWEKGKEWFTTEPFSEPETFVFPAGIGPIECVNVEHEEVLLVPRWVDARRVTFKYGLGDEFIGVLKTIHQLGLDSTDPVEVGGAKVSPRDVVAACLPDPAQIGDRMTGLTCAGTWVTGKGLDGAPREVYLHHVADNEWCMREFGSQAVVWQTAMNPVVALELIDAGTWSAPGVIGPEALPAEPFLDLLAGHGATWGCEERVPTAR